MYRIGERPRFSIFVQNASDYGFTFGLSNIRMQYNASPLKIVRPEVMLAEAVNAAEAAKRAKERAETGGFLTSLVGGVLAVGQLDNVDDFIVDTTLETLDAVQQANADGARVAAKQADLAQARADQALGTYQSEMLKEQAVQPNGHYGGYFYSEPLIEVSDNGFIDVLIDLGDEYHDFRFEINRAAPSP